MIRLMEINELDQALKLVPEQLHAEYTEMLPHLNVYVIEEAGSIEAFMFIIDGYVLGNIHASETVELEKLVSLMQYVQTRYDELMIALPTTDSTYLELIGKTGFEKESTEVDDESQIAYDIYGWSE